MLLSRLALPLTTVLMMSVSSHALADDFKLDSRITDVTVYSDGASITRHADITLPVGNHTLLLKGLPSTLESDAIRAAFDKRGISVRHMSLKAVQSTMISDERRQKIQSAIDMEMAKTRILTDEINTAIIQLDYISRLSPPTNSDKGPVMASAADLQAMLQFIGKNGNDLKETVRIAEIKQQAAKDEINRLQRELGGSSSDKYSYDLTIKAFAARAQSADLKLTYKVDSAHWNLGYDADINSQTNMLSLTQFAKVSQETGENWTGATIILSTEEPSLATEAPELRPNFVDVIDPEILMRAEKRKMELVSADYSMAAPESEVQKITVTATKVINTDFSTSFELVAGSNVSSSPDEQSFELMRHEQKVGLKAVIIPHHVELAFLYADFKYDGTTPLYSGSVELFRNGTYAGSSTISTIQSGEEASFALGQDNKIKVSFIDDGQNNDEKGIFIKDSEQQYRYSYAIENHHDRAFPIEVRAARPVSVNEKLEIEELKGSTKPSVTDWHDLKGVYAWNNELAAGKSWTIKHYYKLKFPNDMRVVSKR